VKLAETWAKRICKTLDPDIDKLTSFVRNSEFKNKVDQDEYSALYYGMNRALLKAGFKASKDEQSELNIILLIGAYGDFRADKDRRRAAAGHPALFNPDKLEKLIDNLYSIDAHMYTIQVVNDGYRASTAFAKGGQYLMLENAKSLNNKRKQRMNSKVLEKLGDIGYKGSYATGPSLDLDDAKEINYTISDYIRSCVKNSIDHVTTLKNAFVELVSKGGEGDLIELKQKLNLEENPNTAGAFEEAFIDELLKTMAENPDLEIPDMTDEKYKLFTEVYIPFKYPESEYPLVSYVLFMPEDDLVEYVGNIEGNFETITGETSYDKKREGLVKIYKSLVDQFTGEGTKFTKKEDDLTIADVQRIINGVYTSGLKLENEIRLKDISNERKISDEQIDELIQRFQKVVDKLNGILRDAETYDFCFSPDGSNRYYWIPIEDTF